MSERIAANDAYLHYLSTLDGNGSRKLMKISCKDNIDCLSEVAKNVALGNIPLTPELEALFRGKYRDLIYFMIDKSVPWSEKRAVLTRDQFGEFPPLLALLAPVITSAIGGVVGGVAKNLVDKAMNKK